MSAEQALVAMGIRVVCPNGHRIKVKSELAGKRGICPECEARFVIEEQPAEPKPQPPAAPAPASQPAEPQPPVAQSPPPIPPAAASEPSPPPEPVADESVAIRTDDRPVVVAHPTVSRRRAERRRIAKRATMLLSVLVFMLLVVLVVVLTRG